MIDINNQYIEATSTHDAALVQMILKDASYKHHIESNTIPQHYPFYPDCFTQEEIAASHRRDKEEAQLFKEVINGTSEEEEKKIKGQDEMLLFEPPTEMDIWSIRFFVEERDEKFLGTLLNQLEDIGDRIKDELYPDPQLRTRYKTIVEKFDPKQSVSSQSWLTSNIK